MPNIARIRSMIAKGLSDADIAIQLQEEARVGSGLEPDSPKRTFQALAATMHRAVREDRAVAAREVLDLLALFRRFLDERERTGEGLNNDSALLARLAKVTVAHTDIETAYAHLHRDMSCLSKSAKILSQPEKEVRVETEKRYLRNVETHPVICCAPVASALADVLEVLSQLTESSSNYSKLFSSEVMQPAMPLLLVYRPTWRELLTPPSFPTNR